MNEEYITKINDNLSLVQKKNGLLFGTDAFLLASYIRKAPHACAADFGSGSGVISLLCASRKKLKYIYAIEAQKVFADIIQQNIILNHLENQVISLHADLRTLTPASVGGELDIIFSNPPYMKTTSGKKNDCEEKYIARHEVLGNIHDFCASAAKLLKFGGCFYTVYRPDRINDLLHALTSNGLEPKRITFVYPTIDAPPCLFLTEAKKGGKPSTFVTPPLILYKSTATINPTYTDELQYIYNNGEFHEYYQKS